MEHPTVSESEPVPKKVKTDTEHENNHVEIAKSVEEAETSSELTDNIVNKCNEDPPAPPTMSKKQMKKLKKLKDWETKKVEKRLREKEKYKRKRLEAIANGLPTRTGPSRKELKRNKINVEKSNFRVAIDLSFDELMIDKDVAKCVKQLLRVYTINRRSKTPINLFFTSIVEGNRLHQHLEKNDGYKNWDVQLKNETYLDLFDRNEIVYLTSDSDNILEKLENDKVYIIGGLVDHNHNKGHCLKSAEELGLQHARLPLGENVVIKTRTVLSIFHVFEILLRVSEGEKWQEAILNVLPSRKGAQPLKEDEVIDYEES